MARRSVKVEDLRGFQFVSDPQISHDGSRTVFVVSTVNHEKDRYDRHLWMADNANGSVTQFTQGPGADTSPRWSPDGQSMLFLSRGRQPEKKTQLYAISATGGEARLLADAEEGVNAPEWAPDSRRVAYTAKVWSGKKPEGDVKVVTRIKHKLNGSGFFEGRRSHLFVVSPGGKPRQVTKGEFDVEKHSWSPDGRTLAFVSNMEPDADTSRTRDIFTIPAKGGDPVKLTSGGFMISDLAYSPDGSQIAFIGYDEPDRLAADWRLYVMPAAGGAPSLLTGGFPRSLLEGIGTDLNVATPSGDPVWSGDGSGIYFMTADIPHCNLYRVDMGGNVETVIGGKTLGGYSVSGEKVAYVAMTGTEPNELFLRDGADRKLTRFNEKLLRKLSLVEPELFTFKNRLGQTVDGWLIKPVGWKKGEKYPCVLEIHGGPRGAHGDGLFLEFQLLAAQGYAVVYTNPRGSSGYDEEYTMGVMRRYGEPDTEDFMDFLDEAQRRYRWIDRDRLGVTGGSYGGFAVNWLISHTDRFKAATTDRCVCNWVSKFGTSDIGYQQPESISGEKTYWGEALFEQMRHSPILYAGNVKTPCLILHSEQDLRCPIEQGEQWFTALKLNGVPCEMVRIPDENHELSRSGKPKHREERLRHHLRWFRRHL